MKIGLREPSEKIKSRNLSKEITSKLSVFIVISWTKSKRIVKEENQLQTTGKS